MMKVRWPGLILVIVLVVGLLLLKHHTRPLTAISSVDPVPSVILVADFREADEESDRCAEIIRAVRQTSKRGVRVSEVSPDSKSDLLRRYHLLTVPTVLLLDNNGKEIGRFEGEDATTLEALNARLAALPGAGR